MDNGGEQPDSRDQESPSSLRKDPPSALPGMTLVKEALPLIGLLLLPGFALRSLVVADFDPTVAVALVQFTQPISFFLTFLLDTLPLLMYSTGLIVLFRTGRSYRDDSLGGWLPATGAHLLALLLSVPILMTAPFPEFFYYAILLAILITSFPTGRPSSLEARFDVAIYWAGVTTILVVFAVFRGMWLAPEVLTIRGVAKTEYVLQQQDQDLIMYDPGLHAVLRVPTTDISYRQFCNIRTFTVAERFLGSPQGQPVCPK